MNWKNTDYRYESVTIGMPLLALMHHHVMHDNTLSQMLPARH